MAILLLVLTAFAKAFVPIPILLFTVTILDSALLPMAILLKPVVLAFKAELPIATRPVGLDGPVDTADKAKGPIGYCVAVFAIRMIAPGLVMIGVSTSVKKVLTPLNDCAVALTIPL